MIIGWVQQQNISKKLRNYYYIDTTHINPNGTLEVDLNKQDILSDTLTIKN